MLRAAAAYANITLRGATRAITIAARHAAIAFEFAAPCLFFAITRVYAILMRAAATLRLLTLVLLSSLFAR